MDTLMLSNQQTHGFLSMFNENKIGFWMAEGMFALGKVVPRRFTPVLFVLRKSNPLERLPQEMFALPEY